MNISVACIGAGRMGRGIAQCAAYSGHNLILLDAKPRSDEDFERLRDDALAEVASALGTLAALNAFEASPIATIMKRIEIHPLGEAASALAQSDIVFEAVPEVEALKAQAFELFDQHAPSDALLASTTSTFLSTMLAKHTVRPKNFLNAHWLNPAFLMPLVELSPAKETTADALARMRSFLESMGKVPIVCKASPGYIVPRIQALAMNEAARIVEEGVASAEDVDKAIAYGFGSRFLGYWNSSTGAAVTSSITRANI
jgi:3-hydroxybutyryl-CoA dehydrogenase